MYHNIITYSSKGGVHKTGVTSHVSSAAIMLGLTLHLFEVDKQKLLGDLFGPLCTTVEMPSASELAAKSTAHLVQLNDMFERMVADNEDLVITDIGAGFEGIVLEAMVTSGLAPMLAGGPRKTALIIPFDNSDESLECAVIASRRGEVVLPEAAQIFCAPNDEFTPNTARSRQLWKDHIAKHVKRHGLMVFNRLGTDVYDIFTAAGVAPHVYAELDYRELARRTGQLPFVARSSILQLSALTAHVARQGERLLGFPRADEPTA
jgi:hypothetical protein